MHPPLGTHRASRLTVVACAFVAGVLALAAALIGAGGASGQAPDYLVPLEPFPIVRIVGEGTKTGARITRLTVRGPTEAAVITTCTPRLRCPFRQRARLIPGPQGATRTIRIDVLERRFRSGATLRLFVVKSGFIGKYASFGIRRGKAPRRFDRCVRGVVLTPVTCPRT